MNKYEQISDIIQRRKEFLNDYLDYEKKAEYLSFGSQPREISNFFRFIRPYVSAGPFVILVGQCHPKNIDAHIHLFPPWMVKMGINFLFYVMYFDYNLSNWNENGRITMDGRDTLDLIRTRFIDEGGSSKEV